MLGIACAEIHRRDDKSYDVATRCYTAGVRSVVTIEIIISI